MILFYSPLMDMCWLLNMIFAQDSVWKNKSADSYALAVEDTISSNIMLQRTASP